MAESEEWRISVSKTQQEDLLQLSEDGFEFNVQEVSSQKKSRRVFQRKEAVWTKAQGHA